MKFVTCEVLNFANVIGQIYLTDMYVSTWLDKPRYYYNTRFLGYSFTKYGRDVFSLSQEDLNNRSDPMDQVFPKVTDFFLDRMELKEQKIFIWYRLLMLQTKH